VTRLSAEEVVRRLASDVGITVDGRLPWDLRVHDRRFYRRVLTDGSLGLGESYMEGWWDCDDLVELHCLIARGRLQAGETVLILGASGATGLAAVQVAKLTGATVIATARIVLPATRFAVVGGLATCTWMRDSPAAPAEICRRASSVRSILTTAVKVRRASLSLLLVDVTVRIGVGDISVEGTTS